MPSTASTPASLKLSKCNLSDKRWIGTEDNYYHENSLETQTV